MKLSEEMKNKTLLSFELFPPKTEKGLQNLPGTIDHLMKYNPSYISCTYGAGGGNVGANREVCQMIKNAGTTPVTHFTVIKNTKEGIKEQLDQYLADGTMMYRHDDYIDGIRLVNEGKVHLKPLISKTFAFKDYLKAYQYIDDNRETTMKVIINVSEK